MKTDSTDSCIARENITAFLFWYRIATMALVVVLMLSGIGSVPLISLVPALIYNIIILIHRNSITRLLRAYPSVLAVDLAFWFYLMLSTGGYDSLYYLYGFSTLLIGSFVLGYRGAFVLATAQSLAFITAVYNGYYTFGEIIASGEHIITDIFFFFVAALSLAYLSNLLNTLDIVHAKQSEARAELSSATGRLRELLKTSDLSSREQEVLMRALDGMKVEEISGDLEISASTVKTYLCRAYKKLGVVSREDAVIKLVVCEQETV